MKAQRSLLVLFLVVTVGLSAQDAPAPAPASAPAPAAPAPAEVAPAPAAPTPAASAPTDAVPANPLAPTPAPAPTAPALDIALPSAGNAAPASATALPNGVMDVANFPNEEIRTIILNVAKLFNLNVVVPDTLTGTTSVQLHDVTWQQIFQVVLEPIGYTFTVNGMGPNAIIMIKNKTDIAAEPMETRVFPVNSAKAEDLAKSLQSFIDTKTNPPESIVPEPRTNYLIVTARPSKMSNLQQAIDKLDMQTQQVVIETKFLEVNSNNDKDLGITWNFNGTPLVSTGYAYQYGLLEGLGALPVSGAMPSTGVVEQTIGGASASPTPSSNLNFLQPASGIASNIKAPFRKAADVAVFNQAQYNAVLQALQNVTNAKLVSNPTAVTLDNMETNIFSGTDITVVFPTINNQTGQTQAGENKTYHIGIAMKVKPHVTNNGFINLTLNPSLSRLDPQTDTYFGAAYPRVDTRQLTDANVSIKDGYTLAIGGLIDDQDSKATVQVPILGDIPVLGNLFKSTETIHTRNNLIIFITARTLDIGGGTYRDVISPDLLLRSGVTAPEIPGYYNNKQHQVSPGMTYVPDSDVNSLENIQHLRDQAAMQQRQQDMKDQAEDAKSQVQH